MNHLNFPEEASFSKDASFFGRRCLLFCKMPPFLVEDASFFGRRCLLFWSKMPPFLQDASFFGRRCLLFWSKMPPFSLENFSSIRYTQTSRMVVSESSDSKCLLYKKTTAGTRQDGRDCPLANTGAI